MDKKRLRVVDLKFLKEECGVVAAYSFKKKDVSLLIYNALIALQHRGQDSAGIASFDGKNINVIKNVGLVSEAIKKSELLEVEGYISLGHVRYPTIGAGGVQDAQPFLGSSKFGKIALAHNGNISNYGLSRDILEKKKIKFCSTCDAELILNNLILNLNNSKDIFVAIKNLMAELDGAYSVCAILDNGSLIVFRDPNAIRPLCWGADSQTIMFASESVALDINSIPLKGNVEAGQVIVIHKNKIEKKIVAPKTSSKHCAFEFIYFSRPDSIQEERLVYEVRYNLGKKLAQKEKIKADVVVPVPDTSRPAAQGYSEQLNIPIVEGLIKNRYIGRTFIMPATKRKEAVRLKLNPIKKLIEGKEIVLIDDSIVRGNTAGSIVSLLKEGGAKKVHFRVACPPIVAPCFYGIDLPNFDDLIAHKKSIEQIRQAIGADSLVYLTIDELVDCIGLPKEKLCLGCLSGVYPTIYSQKLAEIIKQKNPKEDLRIWEEKII
ncbi:MAG: amidophosphoribosyltransferase [Candidatus Micrarchaeota archaeon]|nr:amidophosphoribosyltransferase [Candidatus Micrarchaeota archaeon]